MPPPHLFLYSSVRKFSRSTIFIDVFPVPVYKYMCVCVCHAAHVEVRRQPTLHSSDLTLSQTESLCYTNGIL